MTTYSNDEIKNIIAYWQAKLTSNVHDEMMREAIEEKEEDYPITTPDPAAQHAEQAAKDKFETGEDDYISPDDPAAHEGLVSEKAPGSGSYEPNTVGAVIELLKRSDPNDELTITDVKGMPYFIVDIDRTLRMSNNSTTMKIAPGRLTDF